MRGTPTTYWRFRLTQGRIFHNPMGKRRGWDYRLERDDTQFDWPPEVAKSSLWHDFLEWSGCSAAAINEAEFFKVLGPVLYVKGHKAHTVRRNVPQKYWTGDQFIQGRGQRYFMRLSPLPVCRAHAAVYWGEVEASEAAELRNILTNYAARPGPLSAPFCIARTVAPQPQT